MKLVETVLYGQYRKYNQKLKELEKEAEGFDFINAQLEAAILAGIIIEPTELEEMPINEVMAVYRAFADILAKSLNPETKN
jgi:hypothetical protein